MDEVPRGTPRAHPLRPRVWSKPRGLWTSRADVGSLGCAVEPSPGRIRCRINQLRPEGRNRRGETRLRGPEVLGAP